MTGISVRRLAGAIGLALALSMNVPGFALAHDVAVEDLESAGFLLEGSPEMSLLVATDLEIEEPGDLEAAAFGCGITSGNSKNMQFVGTGQPFGKGGGKMSDGSVVYVVFYFCRTTWTDANGYRYVVSVFDSSQNAAPGKVHIWDHGGSWKTQRYERKAGSGDSIVDKAPSNQRCWGDGGTRSFSLGVAKGAFSGSLSWSKNLPAVCMNPEYLTGAKARWNTDLKPTGAKDVFSTNYGDITRVKAGTYANIHWWGSWNFHHDDWFHNEQHIGYSPCGSPGCGYNTYNVLT